MASSYRGNFMIVESERLILRQWQEGDRVPFYELNSDPITMEFFPNVFTRDQSDSFIDKTIDLIQKKWMGAICG